MRPVLVPYYPLILKAKKAEMIFLNAKRCNMINPPISTVKLYMFVCQCIYLENDYKNKVKLPI